MDTKIFNYKDKSVMFMNYDLDYCYKVADYMIKRPDTKGSGGQDCSRRYMTG